MSRLSESDKPDGQFHVNFGYFVIQNLYDMKYIFTNQNEENKTIVKKGPTKQNESKACILSMPSETAIFHSNKYFWFGSAHDSRLITIKFHSISPTRLS